MLICLNSLAASNGSCRAHNPNGSQRCGSCGKPLRFGFALQLDDPGTRIAHYRVARVIGHGEVGAVYEVQDLQQPERRVALKQTFNPQSLLERQPEILALQGLQHPLLPRYFEMFTEQGKGYLAMELVGGDCLSEVLKNKPLTPKMVVELAAELCDLLMLLHEQTPPILHRDIKPANLRLTPAGIKLVDLGLRAVRGGNGVLKRRYAPLEGTSSGADGRCDVYGLAATLYYLLTNREPLPALARFGSSADPLPPIGEVMPHLEPHLAEAIMKGMSLLRQARHTDAQAFKFALQGVLPSAPTLASKIASPAVIGGAAQVLVVSERGEGHYRSIAEAIREAPADAHILIKPGTYLESLVIDKPLVIKGDGARQEIIIASKNAPCLLMQSTRAEVHGLTLHNDAGWLQRALSAALPAVEIAQGELLLSECHITSDCGSGVAIHGATTHAIIRRCRLERAKHSGIIVFEQAQALIEGCQIVQNKEAGITIKEQSKPIIRQCAIYESYVGILLLQKGEATIEACDIYGNTSAGVEVKQRAKPLLRASRIYGHGNGNGLLISDKGQARVEECHIYDNRRAGIEVKQKGKVFIERCEIYEGKTSGIFVHHWGQAELKACKIYANRQAGVQITADGKLSMEQCQIYQGKRSGILFQNGHGTLTACQIYSNNGAGIDVRESGTPMIRDCDIYSNIEAGIRILQEGNPHVLRSKIRNGLGVGIHVSNKGQGKIEACEIFANAKAGIEIMKNGNPLIQECKIHDGQASGILVEQGQGKIEACEIFGNAEAGIRLRQRANPLIWRSKIYQNQAEGCYIYENAKGTLKECHIFANAYAAIKISQHANPRIRHCHIYKGLSDGVYILEHGRGLLENCQIYENQSNGILIVLSASPIIRYNQINRNGGWAIKADANGGGYVEYNDLRDNALGAWQKGKMSRVKEKGNKG